MEEMRKLDLRDPREKARDLEADHESSSNQTDDGIIGE
jgi:hypothetical protein